MYIYIYTVLNIYIFMWWIFLGSRNIRLSGLDPYPSDRSLILPYRSQVVSICINIPAGHVQRKERHGADHIFTHKIILDKLCACVSVVSPYTLRYCKRLHVLWEHHVEWEDSLFLWPCSRATYVANWQMV